jgi:hypothetical protein
VLLQVSSSYYSIHSIEYSSECKSPTRHQSPLPFLLVSADYFQESPSSSDLT